MRILIISALFACISIAFSCGVDRRVKCCDSDNHMECCCLNERGRAKYVWYCTYSRPYKRPAGSKPRCEKYYENELKMGKMDCLGCGEKGFEC
jgi:hypothetical protein